MTTEENYFDEDELSIAEQITLNKELIRLIEKEIDDSVAANAREGVTIWTLVGGVAGAAFLFFGQTRSLIEIPSITSHVFVLALLLFQFLISLFNFISGGGIYAKRGKILDTRQAFRGRFAAITFRTASLVLLSFFVVELDIPIWMRTATILFSLLPSLYFFVSFILLILTNRPVGNNIQLPRVTLIWGLIFLACYLIPIVLLVSSTPFPIGERITTAFILGISSAAAIVMLELIVALAGASSQVRELRELKDDIVFRRQDLNGALRRFEIIREGKSVLDQMRPEYDRISSHLDRENEILDEQLKLLTSIETLTATDSASAAGTTAANPQKELLLNSYMNYNRELASLATTVNKEALEFQDKLNKAVSASGDHNSASELNQNLTSRHNELVAKQNRLEEIRVRLLSKIERPLDSE